MRAQISNSTIHQNGKLKLQSRELIYEVFFYIIVLVLLFSGFAKIIDPLPLMKTLEALKLFSFTTLEGEINFYLAATLPLFEIGLAILLLMKVNLKLILSITLLLFTGFLFYAVYGYYLGITNDCGCFGNIIKSEFGVGMIVRNFVLFVITVFILLGSIKLLGRANK